MFAMFLLVCICLVTKTKLSLQAYTKQDFPGRLLKA